MRAGMAAVHLVRCGHATALDIPRAREPFHAKLRMEHRSPRAVRPRHCAGHTPRPRAFPCKATYGAPFTSCGAATPLCWTYPTLETFSMQSYTRIKLPINERVRHCGQLTVLLGGRRLESRGILTGANTKRCFHCPCLLWGILTHTHTYTLAPQIVV